MLEIKNNILDIIRSCDTVLFSTFSLNGYPETRYMANIFNKNANDFPLYFVSRRSSNKIKQIKNNKNICLYYFNQNTRKAITLFGTSIELYNQKIKDDFWINYLKNYGFQNKNDKDYTIIKFVPQKYKYFLSTFEEKTGELI